jgi:hypothetical protein
MSDKNLEQRINIKFRVKIGKSASETLALLAVAYGEYALKNSSVFSGLGGSRKGEKMCEITQDVCSQKRKEQMQMWTEYEPWCAQISILLKGLGKLLKCARISRSTSQNSNPI